jgi:hypothetical protein
VRLAVSPANSRWTSAIRCPQQYDESSVFRVLGGPFFKGCFKSRSHIAKAMIAEVGSDTVAVAYATDLNRGIVICLREE